MSYIRLLYIFAITFFLAFIILLVLLANEVVAFICLIFCIICIIILYISFSKYTNKYHDLNSSITLIPYRIFKNGNDKEIKIVIYKSKDKWTFMRKDEEYSFNLDNYPLKKTFIKAFFIRCIYYQLLKKGEPIGKFFKSTQISKLNEVRICFVNECSSKEYIIAKNGKTRITPLIQIVLLSKFLAYTLNRHTNYFGKNINFSLNEEWYLK